MGNPGKRRPVPDGGERAHHPLSGTRRGNFLFLAVYFPAVVLGHDVVQKAVHSLQDRLPPVVYTTLVNGSHSLQDGAVGIGAHRIFSLLRRS